MSNHEGYPDPTAETAVERVFRLDKRKKLRFVRRYLTHTGDLPGESTAKKKQRLMEDLGSVNAGIASGESAAASGERIHDSAQNGKFDAGKRQEVNPDDCDL